MAEINEALISGFLTYGKLEELEHDALELALVADILAADADYLSRAGVPEDSAQWRLCLYGMALHDYDHRDDPAAQQAYPLAVRLKIDQLKQSNFIYG